MRTIFLATLSILFVMFWSSGWIVAKFAVGDIGGSDIHVTVMLTVRYLIVLAVVSLLLLVSGGIKRRFRHINVNAHLMVGALAHGIYLLAGIGAFELGVSAALVAFVTALQPMLTAALSRPITLEPVSQSQWKGLVVGFCAVMLLVSQSYSEGISGLVLAMPFIAVLSLSLGTLINRRLELINQAQRRRPDSILSVLFLHCIGALIVLVPLSLAHDPMDVKLNNTQWFVILWLALVVSLGAYAILLLLLRHMTAMKVSSLSYLVPPVTMIQAWLVYGDSINMLDALALMIAALGVIVATRTGRKKTIACNPGMRSSIEPTQLKQSARRASRRALAVQHTNAMTGTMTRTMTRPYSGNSPSTPCT
ncbi:MAG: DMT family transporter [Granulosicoccus sp.]|nr:DMT family transporter [Granulosicoccus sp.]